MSKHIPRLFITGCTGYIGSHVLDQAVQAGYHVRVAVRERKVSLIREIYGDKVEVVVIDDIATDNFVESLIGVDAIIHLAAGLPVKEKDYQAIISSTIKGTHNILNQALSAGVKRVVITTTLTTVTDSKNPEVEWSDYVYTDKDWNSLGMKDLVGEDVSPMIVYSAAKTIAEREIWKFADEHEGEIDITTIIPPYVFGPFAKAYVVPRGQYEQMGSVGFFYRAAFLGSDVKLPAVQRNIGAITVDVRDMARVHILACFAPFARDSNFGRKRILVGGPRYTIADAIRHLRQARPELTPRLADPSDALPQAIARLDDSKLQGILQFGEFIPWKVTVEDMVDAIVSIERQWDVLF